ncbi:MAG: hypothetical protein OXB98_01070 [Bryobacterales bacterium]|nr:hypothetical protein [Bryobacterales bacterium]
MSGEIIAIVTVGIALAGLLVGLFFWLLQDIKEVAERVGRLEYSQAKLEGLLEGLREAITGRVAT